MSHVIEVKQNPDGSWTATGGSSITVVSVTCLTEHRAVAFINVALNAITSQVKS